MALVDRPTGEHMIMTERYRFLYLAPKGIWDRLKKIGILEMKAKKIGILDMRAENNGIRERRILCRPPL